MKVDHIQRQVDELGPWVSGFRYQGVEYAPATQGGYLLSQRPEERAESFFRAFPEARRILELGALEGADTVALAGRPGTSVTAIEGRPENVRRAELALRLHGTDGVDLRVADVERTELSDLGRFDAVLCAGLLYHVREPWKLLANIARTSSCLYLSTHYWGAAEGLVPHGRYKVKEVHEEHPEPLARGLSEHVRWLDRASLFVALEDSGFTEVQILHERVGAGVCDIVAVCR